MNETENQTRLRRAKETLAACQAAEVEARKALASAIESTRRAKERQEEFFALEERQEFARRLADFETAIVLAEARQTITSVTEFAATK